MFSRQVIPKIGSLGKSFLWKIPWFSLNQVLLENLSKGPTEISTAYLTFNFHLNLHFSPLSYRWLISFQNPEGESALLHTGWWGRPYSHPCGSTSGGLLKHVQGRLIKSGLAARVHWRVRVLSIIQNCLQLFQYLWKAVHSWHLPSVYADTTLGPCTVVVENTLALQLNNCVIFFSVSEFPSPGLSFLIFKMGVNRKQLRRLLWDFNKTRFSKELSIISDIGQMFNKWSSLYFPLFLSLSTWLILISTTETLIERLRGSIHGILKIWVRSLFSLPSAFSAP